MAEQNTKREQILRATLELILENGLQAASMSLISRRADVPVGTIYRIFPGKEALVNALYQECRDLLFASITDPQGEDLPPREAFHAMFGRYIRTALEHREEFLFVEQYLLSPVISEEGRIGTDFRLGQRSLTELTRDGVLRDLDPLILDAVVLGTANQLLCLHFAGHLALDDAAIRAALDACWHAIAAAPRLTE